MTYCVHTSSKSKFNCYEISILINLRVCTNILYNKYKARKPLGLFSNQSLTVERDLWKLPLYSTVSKINLIMTKGI